MPVFTKTFAIIAGLLSVPVFGASIIGANYASPFLEHLVDIVNGTMTTTIVSLNAPNWGRGIQLPTVVGMSVATSTGGTMASSTTEYFAVSALDGTGTTTISASVSATTDASTTLLTAEAYEITWAPVSGATGYAIYFGPTASTLSSYFYATTSGAFYLSTTTSGQLTGSYTSLDTTAFASKINPSGMSYVNGNSTATSSTVASTTAFQVNGNLVSTSPATTTQCFAGTAGAVFFNTQNKHEWGCDGTNWNKIF